MQLPEEFIRQTRSIMGEERFARYLSALDEESPVSIRLNPFKSVECRVSSLEFATAQGNDVHAAVANSTLYTLNSKLKDAVANSTLYTLNSALSPVPWCRNAYYLSSRPNFTFDPLFHAGCYYVQEAASMFLDTIINSVECRVDSVECRVDSVECRVDSVEFATAQVNDVHAAVANSTLYTLNSKLKDAVANSTLYTLHSKLKIALDLCAAPGGKSTLLRSALPEGSILYSNEPVPKRASILLENITKWGHPECIVTNSYPKDYCASKLCFDVILCDVPCSGEGMFRKDPQTIREWSLQNVEKCWRLQREIVADAWQCLNPGGLLIYSTCTFNTKENEENIRWILDNFDAEALPLDTKPEWGITGSLLPGFNAPVYRFIPGITRSEGLFMAVIRKVGTSAEKRKPNLKALNILSSPLAKQLSVASVELSYQQAMAYLRGEALVFPPSTPRGVIDVSFMGHRLGQAKNVGNRANNLYPKEWRIRTTHIPNEYQPILNPQI